MTSDYWAHWPQLPKRGPNHGIKRWQWYIALQGHKGGKNGKRWPDIIQVAWTHNLPLELSLKRLASIDGSACHDQLTSQHGQEETPIRVFTVQHTEGS